MKSGELQKRLSELNSAIKNCRGQIEETNRHIASIDQGAKNLVVGGMTGLFDSQLSGLSLINLNYQRCEAVDYLQRIIAHHNWLVDEFNRSQRELTTLRNNERKCISQKRNTTQKKETKTMPIIPTTNISAPEIKAFDFFISHASENKEDFAEPLARMLIEKNTKVWLDRWEIQCGDSIGSKINEGLAYSRFGIVVLSREFFTKPWAKAELDSLFARHMFEKKVILPIWLDLTTEEIKKHYPLLLPFFALEYPKQTIGEIVLHLVEILKRKN